MRMRTQAQASKSNWKITPSVLFLGFALLPVAATPAVAEQPARSAAQKPPASSAAKETILKRCRAVVTTLKNNDTLTLSYYIHPDKKLRVCPNFYISKEDLFLNRVQVKKLNRDRTVRHWGTEDPADKPIKCTWKEYRRQYVYPRDFARLKKENILYDKFVSRGNSLEGLKKGFPNAIFVEYYFPGTKKYDGIDWRSLWLIWEKKKSTWYLTGIASNQWTP